MKFLLGLALATITLAPISIRASDIRLRDGTILREATIVREDGKQVFIRAANGSAWYRKQAIQPSSAPREWQAKESAEKTIREQEAAMQNFLAGLRTRLKAARHNGSGAFVTSDGLVLTAAHIVAEANRIDVVSQAEASISPATVVAINRQYDLALLQVAGTHQALPMGRQPVELGQAVSTIGYPLLSVQGLSPKLTRGEISSLFGARDDPLCWQISAQVQPGNSGGPLLDNAGNLIGVVVSKLSMTSAIRTSDLVQNVNYAVKGQYVLSLFGGKLQGAPAQRTVVPKFEDMVATAIQSSVLILVY